MSLWFQIFDQSSPKFKYPIKFLVHAFCSQLESTSDNKGYVKGSICKLPPDSTSERMVFVGKTDVEIVLEIHKSSLKT